MGVDLLDLRLRLERDFKIDLDYRTVGWQDGKFSDVMAGDIWRWIEVQLRQPPSDCWLRVRRCIAETVIVDPDTITPTTRLVDLGFT